MSLAFDFFFFFVSRLRVRLLIDGSRIFVFGVFFHSEIERRPTMHQTETREASLRLRIPAVIENVLPMQQSASILLQASVSKVKNANTY